MITNFANKQARTMKKIVILLALTSFFVVGAYAQREQANWNAANYYAYDTTTFFLGSAKGVQWVSVDFSTLNADDAVLKIGGAEYELDGRGDMMWTSATADSVILDTSSSVYTQTTRKSDGTRYTASRVNFWFSDGFPTSYIAITIVWNSVTSGRVKVRF